MGTHYSRHISRLTSYNGQPQIGDDLVKLVNEQANGYDQKFTCKHFLKIQIMPTNLCKVKINGHSEVILNPTYGLILDYTDLVIHSFEFLEDPGDVYAVIGY